MPTKKSSTVRIASRLAMPIRITEPHPNPEKPGDSPELRYAILAGAGSTIGSVEGITEVDSELYQKWKEANPNFPGMHLLREIEGDDDLPEPEFGWEDALKRSGDDKDNSKLASEGSLIKGPGPVKAIDMNATSSTPNDDSPRSQVGPNPVPVGPGSAGPGARPIGPTAPLPGVADSPKGAAPGPADAPKK